MASTQLAKPNGGAPPPVQGEEFKLLPMLCLRESTLNPRKHFDARKLQDLAESVRQFGVLTPLLVRRHRVKEGYFEIAAGHRRFRAAKLAGTCNALPCRIMDLNDNQFREVLSIENVQREDVHPMEEADGYIDLIENCGYTTQSLADRIGKPEAYVRGRIELCDLIDVVRQSFLDDNITIGHARLISRLDPAKQEEALRSCFVKHWNDKEPHLISLREFRAELKREQGTELAKAPFDLSDKTLKSDAGACTTCPKCAGGVQRLLLADDTSEQLCLDRSCYSQKINAFVQRKTAAGLVAISTRYPEPGIPGGVLSAAEYVEVEPDTERIEQLREEVQTLKAEFGRPDFDEADRAETENQLKSTAEELREAEAEFVECKHFERAVLVHAAPFDHKKLGSEMRICRNRECEIHGEQLFTESSINRGRSGSSAPSFGDIWKEKRKNLDDKIKIEARREATRQLYRNCPAQPDHDSLQAVADRLAERIGHDITAELVTHILKLDAPKRGGGVHGVDVYKPFRKLIDDTSASKDLAGLWRLIVLMTVATAPSGYGGEEELKDLAKRYKVDQQAITKRIADPLIEQFNKRKASAQAKEKAAKKAGSAAQKDRPKPTRSGKMAAAGDDSEDGEE